MPRWSAILAIHRARTAPFSGANSKAACCTRSQLSARRCLTIQLGINTPRYASLRSIKQAAAKPIEVLSLADLELDRRRCRGSRVTVASATHVRSRQRPRAIDRGQPGQKAQRLAEIIRNSKETQYERHAGHCGTAAGGIAAHLAGARRRRPDAAPRRRASRGGGPRQAPGGLSAPFSVAGVDAIITVKTAAAGIRPRHLRGGNRCAD